MSPRWLPTLLLTLTTLLWLSGAVPSATAHDDDGDDRDGGVERFATLPKPGPGFPEGIAADRAGNIYVATFDFTQTNNIYVFRHDGRLKTTIPLPGAAPAGPGLERRRRPLRRRLPQRQRAEVRSSVHGQQHAGGDPARLRRQRRQLRAERHHVRRGRQSLRLRLLRRQGVQDRLPAGDALTTFVAHDLLSPGSHGFPPFGANGLAFSADGTQLFIANTADDRILKYDVALKTVTVFAESINGADGIAFDHRERLWVCANQADELVALNAKGRVVERRGSFRGIAHDGAARAALPGERGVQPRRDLRDEPGAAAHRGPG